MTIEKQTKKSFYARFALVQQEAGQLKKDGNNPHFKNKYVTLDTINSTLVGLLVKHDLVLYQTIETTEAGASSLVTTVADTESEQKISSRYPLNFTGQTSQQQGSMITYARRYTLSCLFSLSSEEDDDGEAASRASMPAGSNWQRPVAQGQARPQQTGGQKPVAPRATAEQAAKIRAEIARTGSNEAELLASYHTSTWEKTTQKAANYLLAQLAKKPAVRRTVSSDDELMEVLGGETTMPNGDVIR